jgi:hypothetical protein
VRTDLIFDVPTLRAISARGRELRAEAGTLGGMAADAAPVRRRGPNTTLIEDLLSVWEPGDEDTVWSGVLCRRLAERLPDRYPDWDANRLGKALASAGVETKQLNRDNTNRRGPSLLDLLSALARLGGRRPAVLTTTARPAPAASMTDPADNGRTDR